MRTGGQLIVDCLITQGVERVFCVPGESYLAVLDALVDSGIGVITARHEGGASMMAEADGKLSRRPGVAIVTRGPGATNAACGLHVAQQDSTPLILLVGQIARDQRGRDAFQEMDYARSFASIAKWVAEIDSARRVPEMMARAWHTALNGRPGPVVLALPEDMLREQAAAALPARVEPASPSPAPRDIQSLRAMVERASAPIILAGGSGWTRQASEQLAALAAQLDIPVACTFRRQSIIDNHSSVYAGDLGIAANPELVRRIQSSDLLILIGGRLSEIPSQGYTLLSVPSPDQPLVHVHPGAEELGRVYTPALAINASPANFIQAWFGCDDSTGNDHRTKQAHADYRSWSDDAPTTPGDLQMGHVVITLRECMPPDTIYCNGAGNYAGWLHRFMRYKPGTQLAPTSGSMGYGLPAAIAAKIRHPDRHVVCLAGDGCFQMTLQELGSTRQHGLGIIVLVVDNGLYGTIRMHQARDYPGRIIATTLDNPDFAAIARAYGARAETIATNDEFDRALQRAQVFEGMSLLHLKIDPDAITPTKSLAEIESMGSA